MTAPLSGLLAWIQDLPAYRALRDSLSRGATLTAPLLPTARPPLIASLGRDLAVPLLIVTASSEAALRWRQSLRLWLDTRALLTFPAPPTLFYERSPWPPELRGERLRTLAALYHYRMAASAAPPLIIAPARALMYRTLPYRQYRKAVRKIAVGTTLAPRALARLLRGWGYEVAGIVTRPGQFSLRGGLLDVFPAPLAESQETAYRVEFFGDEVDTIRTFDPQTQRSTGRAEHFWVFPAREALPQHGERALPYLEPLLAQDLPADVRAHLAADAQALADGAPFPALEFYLPAMYQERGSLLHHLPPRSLIIVVGDLAARWQTLEASAAEQRTAAESPLPLPESAPPYLSWATFRAQLDSHQVLTLAEAAESVPAPLDECFSDEARFAGRLPEAMGRIRQWVGLGDQVVVASRQAARLAELWQSFHPPLVRAALDAPPEGLITFVQASVPGGWQLTSNAGTRHLLSDEELFGWRPPQPRRRPRRTVLPKFDPALFKEGEYVVHEDFGVGIFRGLVTRAVDEIQREYLLVEYAGRDRLFVPVHQADRLTRYVGAGGGSGPSISRLGSTQWQAAKERARQATQELAAEMLNLYAARQVVEGFAFSPDTPWQHELEASFPYVETEDQARAIAAVKADMEKPRPMDRLICGDAGYGKTEVALRAAFKAVMDGKQVAMLVPTTILAEQHYRTFKERLEPFPVRVELLSRFRTPAEQRAVLQGMREGQVDIVIGTHRLLQKDVAFHDLGLVIVDEEQRFGVVHKERLKHLRTQVDVLTLTATPIPRTLYLALTGVRDINIIEMPPQERVPISTYVGSYDADITRRAILRELQRSGQTFYVHNRVGSIHDVALRLRTLVPEARIAVAHGQMREHDLAQVMRRFAAGEVDVLIATTIIESGLDFPNANTLIVERADMFGLAQLYQLRGRVGRGTRRGYAYFFHARRLKPEARERLRALQETNSLGGGFSLALRDLELRGAGELLGARQHGNIASVGFSLYTQMLTRAVNELRAKRAGQPLPPAPLSTVTLELPLAVGLPTEYISDDRLRLQLYRRMAELTQAEEIADLEAELRDRFGPLPDPTRNLLFQLQLKLLARDAGVPAITVESGQIVIRPPWLQKLSASRLLRLKHALGDRARVGRRDLWLSLSWDVSRWSENLRQVLLSLRQFVTEAR